MRVLINDTGEVIISSPANNTLEDMLESIIDAECKLSLETVYKRNRLLHTKFPKCTGSPGSSCCFSITETDASAYLRKRNYCAVCCLLQHHCPSKSEVISCKKYLTRLQIASMTHYKVAVHLLEVSLCPRDFAQLQERSRTCIGVPGQPCVFSLLSEGTPRRVRRTGMRCLFCNASMGVLSDSMHRFAQQFKKLHDRVPYIAVAAMQTWKQKLPLLEQISFTQYRRCEGYEGSPCVFNLRVPL